MIKSTIKLYRMLFFNKANKEMQGKTTGEMFCKFTSMKSFSLNSRLSNFITS